MRHLAALLVASFVALSGCSLPEAEDQEPSDAPPSAPAPADRADEVVCAEVLVRPDRFVVRQGEPLNVTATLHNCGTYPLTIKADACKPFRGFRFWIERAGLDWRLSGERVPRTAGDPGLWTCAARISELVIPPSRDGHVFIHEQTARWDGTFGVDPCWPRASGQRTACLQFLPAMPEPLKIAARIEANGRSWEGNATVQVLPAQPVTATVDAGACMKLDVRAQPSEIPAGQESLVRIGLRNCGTNDLPLNWAHPCGPQPLQLLLRQGDTTRHVLGGAAAAGAWTCHGPLPIGDDWHHVALVGSAAWRDVVWNGTVFDDYACEETSDWRRCSARTSSAPPGEHTLEAVYATPEGDAWRANTTVRILAD